MYIVYEIDEGNIIGRLGLYSTYGAAKVNSFQDIMERGFEEVGEDLENRFDYDYKIEKVN